MEFRPAETPISTALECAVCKTPLTENYYVAGNAIVCRACGTLIDAGAPTEGRVRRVLGALALGSLFGFAGTVLYSAIIALANFELALLTILIGWLVGTGVRKGAQGRAASAIR